MDFDAFTDLVRELFPETSIEKSRDRTHYEAGPHLLIDLYSAPKVGGWGFSATRDDRPAKKAVIVAALPDEEEVRRKALEIRAWIGRGCPVEEA